MNTIFATFYFIAWHFRLFDCIDKYKEVTPATDKSTARVNIYAYETCAVNKNALPFISAVHDFWLFYFVVEFLCCCVNPSTITMMFDNKMVNVQAVDWILI